SGCPSCLCDAYGHKITRLPTAWNGEMSYLPGQAPGDCVSTGDPYSPTMAVASRIRDVNCPRKRMPMIPHRAPWLRTLAIAVVGLTLLALYTWVFHAVYTSRGPSSATDFYTVYRGTKALVTEGLNPYSEDVTHLIQ